MIQTAQNIASRLYSLFIKTIAPRCMASEISLSFPSPAGALLIFRKTRIAAKSPNKPKPIGKKALEIIKVSPLLTVYLLVVTK